LNVAEMAANVAANIMTICPAEPVELTSTVFGGSGTLTYTWTSDPVGFSSSEANVTVSPVVNTTYYLEVSDGVLFATDQFTIQVNPLPVVYIGADTTICEGQSIVLIAGEGFASYLWNTGETTPTIETAVQDSYSVTVTNEFNCSSSDTLYLTVTHFPVKPVPATARGSAAPAWPTPSATTSTSMRADRRRPATMFRVYRTHLGAWPRTSRGRAA